MQLDPRLVAIGFYLEGKLLRGEGIVNCTLKQLPEGEGVQVQLPSGEVITVKEATDFSRVSLKVSGPGKTGLIV